MNYTNHATIMKPGALTNAFNIVWLQTDAQGVWLIPAAAVDSINTISANSTAASSNLNALSGNAKSLAATMSTALINQHGVGLLLGKNQILYAFQNGRYAARIQQAIFNKIPAKVKLRYANGLEEEFDIEPVALHSPLNQIQRPNLPAAETNENPDASAHSQHLPNKAADKVPFPTLKPLKNLSAISSNSSDAGAASSMPEASSKIGWVIGAGVLVAGGAVALAAGGKGSKKPVANLTDDSKPGSPLYTAIAEKLAGKKSSEIADLLNGEKSADAAAILKYMINSPSTNDEQLHSIFELLHVNSYHLPANILLELSSDQTLIKRLEKTHLKNFLTIVIDALKNPEFDKLFNSIKNEYIQHFNLTQIKLVLSAYTVLIARKFLLGNAYKENFPKFDFKKLSAGDKQTMLKTIESINNSDSNQISENTFEKVFILFNGTSVNYNSGTQTSFFDFFIKEIFSLIATYNSELNLFLYKLTIENAKLHVSLLQADEKEINALVKGIDNPEGYLMDLLYGKIHLEEQLEIARKLLFHAEVFKTELNKKTQTTTSKSNEANKSPLTTIDILLMIAGRYEPNDPRNKLIKDVLSSQPYFSHLNEEQLKELVKDRKLFTQDEIDGLKEQHHLNKLFYSNPESAETAETAAKYYHLTKPAVYALEPQVNEKQQWVESSLF